MPAADFTLHSDARRDIRPCDYPYELEKLGEDLPAHVYLGSSSWSFPGWKGIVYSAQANPRHDTVGALKEYAQFPVFRTAGIDRAYYRNLSEEQYRRFAAAVPEDFRFLVKAPQSLTDAVLRDRFGRPLDANPDFLNVEKTREEFLPALFSGLAAKAGPVVFQMPPFPREIIRTQQKQYEIIERIGAFFAALPRTCGGQQPLYAVEMRTASLLTPRYLRAIREGGARMVIGIHPGMPSVMRQTDALRYLDGPDHPTGEWTAAGDIIVRWSLSHEHDATYRKMKEDWAPFDRIRRPDIVTRSGIALLADVAARSGHRLFAVANNKAEGSAPLTMQAVAGLIAEKSRDTRSRLL